MAEKVERTENKDNDNRKKFYKHKQKRDAFVSSAKTETNNLLITKISAD